MVSSSAKTRLLSILIPTRNRQSYCLSTIESVLKIDGNNFELVVHDNSDTNELEGMISSRFNDGRLIYKYTNADFSPVDNFNAAAGLAVGRFFCFIGDDDSVNPELIHAAEWAERNGVDTLSWNIAKTSKN